MTRHEDAEPRRDPGSVGSLLAALLLDARSVLVVGPDDDLVKTLVDHGCPARLEADEQVDAVVLGAVLEVSAHVEQVLRDATGRLGPDGRLLLVVPNAGHGSRRLAGLQGADPDLTEPRRAFTADSLSDLATSAGLRVEELHATMRDPLDTDVAVDPHRLPHSVVAWVRHQPGALEHVYVAVARPSTADEPPGPRPETVVTAPARTVRAHDEHDRREREDRELNHRLLTLRDHVIGLETTTATAVARAAEAQERARLAERQTRRLRRKLAELTAEVRTLRETHDASSRGLRGLVRRLRGRGPVG